MTWKFGFDGRPINVFAGRKCRVGSVFVVHDSEFWPDAPLYKPRQVVVLANDRRLNRLLVAPVRKIGPIVPLENFDGGRCVNVNKSVSVPYSSVYGKNGFRNTGNSYLTRSERIELWKQKKRGAVFAPRLKKS